MRKVIVKQSDYDNNPLEDMGCVIINRENTKENEVKDKLISLDKDHKIYPIYVYDHSGRVFRHVPFSCNWDSGLYGSIAIPNDMINETNNIDDELVISLLELFTQWAEGEVYDFIICNTEDEDISFDYISELNLESIDFDEMLEDNDLDLVQYMKDNKIYKNNIKNVYDDVFDEFRDRYIGKNIFGNILKTEIEGKEWINCIYGYENCEKEILKELDK